VLFVVALGRASLSGSGTSLRFFLELFVKDQLEQYVKQVKEWHEDCRGNEQATKASLITPLFKILGYNMHDPRECKPEYRMDFGRGEKAATPVDWAFLINGAFAFFVEAKQAGAKLAMYSEQLGMYFGKEPGVNGVKLGILTNGTHWQFFTDLRNDNAMDKEPFFTWDVLRHDPAHAVEILTILQKSEFTPQRIRAFADRRYRKTLLVGVLNRLLEPSPEFVRLAISSGVNDADETLVSGKITEKVIEQWTPILAEAIHEWARQHDLTIALQHPSTGTELGTTRDDDKAAAGKKASATGQELGQVALSDIISAGLLNPPLRLFRKYKGQMLEAELRADGQVKFKGAIHHTCSAAGEAARGSMIGGSPHTNGWTFWQFQDAHGATHTLADARKQFQGSAGKHLAHGEKPQPSAGAGQKGSEDGPERHKLRKRFWEALLSRPGVAGTPHASIAASKYSWLGAASGVHGLQFVYSIQKTAGRVELYIYRGAGNAAENKAIFERLRKHKDEIEAAFGGELSWQRLDDKQGCRIACETTGGGYRTEKSKWPGIQDAMIEAMARLEKALAPHLMTLKTELA